MTYNVFPATVDDQDMRLFYHGNLQKELYLIFKTLFLILHYPLTIRCKRGYSNRTICVCESMCVSVYVTLSL